MNLIIALDELERARGFVVDGEKCLSQQRGIVDRLERRGSDTTDAIQFLIYLEEVQEQYMDHCDRMGLRVMGFVKPDED